MKKLVLSAFKLQDKDNFAKKFEIFIALCKSRDMPNTFTLHALVRTLL